MASKGNKLPTSETDPFAFLAGGGEMGRLIRAKDWSKTPIGPPEVWPQSLRTAVSLCLASNFPINIIWGPGCVQVYNDGYRDCCGDAHPRALGEDYRVTWASAWPAIGESFERALAGETMYLRDQRMFLRRLAGNLEETFFTFSHSPIRDEPGGVGGLFHPVTETTATLLAERRTRALRDLAARTGEAQSVQEALALSAQTLAAYDLDLPFVLLYALDADGRQARLVASTGLEAGRPASPEVLPVGAPGPAVWPVEEVVRSRAPVQVDGVGPWLGPPPCGPYPEPPTTALVSPILPPGADRPAALFIAGVSARLPLTEAYRSFYQLLAAGVTTAVANASAHEAARQPAEEALREREAWMRGQREALEAALNDAPLETSLGILVQTATDGLGPGTRAAFHLANGRGTALHHVVGMPADYAAAVEGFAIGADSRACGLATHTGEPVLTTDVMTDPRWEPWRWMAERFGYRGCWSFPIRTSSGRFVGTFAVYWTQPREATRRDLKLAALLTDTAAIIISRHHEAAARQRAEAAQRESEQRQAFLLKLSDALRPLGDPAEIKATASRFLGEQLHVNRAFYAEAEGDDWLVVKVVSLYEQGVPLPLEGEHPTAPLGRWIVDEFRAGRRLVVRDVRADERYAPPQRAVNEALHVIGSVGVPLVKDGALVAVLVVQTAAPRDWQEYEIALVEETAQRIWAAVEWAKAEAALRESEGRFRTLSDTAPALIWRNDAAGENRFISRYFLDYTGKSAEQIAGEGWHALVHPDDAPAYIEGYLATVRDQQSWRGRNRIRRHDGAWRWFENHARPLFGPAGEYLGHVGVSVDVQEAVTAEERLRLALAAARMGIWTLDVGTGAQTRDANLNRLLGLEPAETTQPFEEFLTHLHRADRPAVAEAFAASTREGRPLNVEFRVVRPDGSVRWLRDQGDVFGDAAAGARRMAGACVDVTERVEAEERLRASEGRLRQILASATDFAIFTLDADRRVTGWSPGAEAVFGWPEAEILGRSGDELFTPEDRAAGGPGQEVETARREGRAADERWHARKDGSRFYASGVMTPLDGGFVKVLRDLTERKRMEDELREADRRKDEFLAMLGHELRNPLAPLRGLMETLQRQQLDGPALARAYAMMERQVGHLTRLVDDLLDVSRITRGLIELRKEPVNLAEVAAQAVEMVASVVEGRGHDLQLSLPRKPLRVEGDSARLTQVVFNLLNNAAKYTDAGGRIGLTVEGEGGRAVVRVRDNGSGMKPELVPRVFDLFTQGERTPDRSQGGLGLGLTLVKRLVEMHGGTVEAHSEGPGKGSEFVVRLPALPAEEAKPAPARGTGPPQAAVRLDRALVIDDNFDVAESITWMLEGLAREIKMAHSGAAALEVAPEFKPDVILCDLGMPGMDGYETCRRLRQVTGLEKVLIAAVSGYGGPEDRRKSQEAGFDRHLVKPIGRATLEELVQSAAGA